MLTLSVSNSCNATIFTPDDSANKKVLKLIEWVASVNDLAKATKSLPNALGISQPPNTAYADVNGRHIKDWTDYLYDAPIWPGAKSKLEYTVPKPGAPADSWRADIRFYLDLNEREVCIHKADLMSLFGPPRLLPGGDGPIDYAWVLRSDPYETIVLGNFGFDGTDCDPYLTIIEYPESGQKRQREHYLL